MELIQLQINLKDSTNLILEESIIFFSFKNIKNKIKNLKEKKI